MNNISHNVKFYRQHFALTQQEIADKLKTTIGRVKTYESGVAAPQIEMLVSIAQMMNVSIDTLVQVKLTDKNYLVKQADLNVVINTRIDQIEQAMREVSVALDSVRKIAVHRNVHRKGENVVKMH